MALTAQHDEIGRTLMADAPVGEMVRLERPRCPADGTAATGPADGQTAARSPLTRAEIGRVVLGPAQDSTNAAPTEPAGSGHD